jgi:hypothetical protein
MPRSILFSIPSRNVGKDPGSVHLTKDVSVKIARCLHLFALLALLAASAVSGFCQSDTGILLGTIVDPTQAVVADASVTLRNTATGATTTTKTNREGVFQLPEFNAFGTTYTSNVNTNTTTGQYTSTLNPRQQELSVRLVF